MYLLHTYVFITYTYVICNYHNYLNNFFIVLYSLVSLGGSTGN